MSAYRCEVCDYVYDEATGEPREGFPAGTPWHAVPEDWCCPDCGVREKIDFLPVVPGELMSRVPYPQAARALLRDTIVDAVDDLVRARGWSATTMSDVAAAAGVSRQTVYNEFGSRQDLVQAYVLREIETLVSEVESHVRAHADDARAALSGAFELFLKLASDEPLVRVIVADAEGGELVRLLTTTGLAVATDRVGALIEQVWPQVAPDDARLIAESLARLAISHALAPTSGADDAAAAVTRLVGPFVDGVLATGAP